MAEFEEELLFDEEEEGQKREWSGSSSDEDEGAASPQRETETPGGVDIVAGTSLKSASLHSSTLRASLDERLHDDADAALLDRPGPQRHFHPVAASLPARTSAVQMGSSVPIAIPSLPRWKIDPAAAPPGAAEPAGPRAAGDAAAAAFVPPHKLTRHEDFSFSFNGASPSATLKRERLRQRNAVLRSTGFLEPKPDGAPGADAAAAAAAAPGGPRGGGGGGGGGVAQSLPATSGLSRLELHMAQQPLARAGGASGGGAAAAASSLTAALTTIGEAA